MANDLIANNVTTSSPQIGSPTLAPAWGSFPAYRERPVKTPAPGGLLTLRQAATYLGISERTHREHMRAGSIRYIDVGRGKERRAPRFAPNDLTEFWNSTGARHGRL
jgi:excisionase family DNA binding protein